jgi:hypothetical protein
VWFGSCCSKNNKCPEYENSPEFSRYIEPHPETCGNTWPFCFWYENDKKSILVNFGERVDIKR